MDCARGFARGYCVWCDADELAAAQATADGQRIPNQFLNIFMKLRPDIGDVDFVNIGRQFVALTTVCRADIERVRNTTQQIT